MATGETHIFGKHFGKRKKQFFTLLIGGITPHRAFMHAFKIYSPELAKKLVTKLLEIDREIFEEITMGYKEILDKHGLDDETIAQEITDIAKNNKSPKYKLEALRLALELRGELAVKGVLPAPPATIGALNVGGITITAPRMGGAVETTAVEVTDETSNLLSPHDDDDSAPAPDYESPAPAEGRSSQNTGSDQAPA